MCVTNQHHHTCGHVVTNFQKCPLTTQSSRFPACKVFAQRSRHSSSRCNRCVVMSIAQRTVVTAPQVVGCENDLSGPHSASNAAPWVRFTGFICGHSLSLSLTDYPGQVFEEDQVNQQGVVMGQHIENRNGFCRGCQRIVWNINYTESERRHRLLHAQGRCDCGEALTTADKIRIANNIRDGIPRGPIVPAPGYSAEDTKLRLDSMLHSAVQLWNQDRVITGGFGGTVRHIWDIVDKNVMAIHLARSREATTGGQPDHQPDHQPGRRPDHHSDRQAAVQPTRQPAPQSVPQPARRPARRSERRPERRTERQPAVNDPIPVRPQLHAQNMENIRPHHQSQNVGIATQQQGNVVSQHQAQTDISRRSRVPAVQPVHIRPQQQEPLYYDQGYPRIMYIVRRPYGNTPPSRVMSHHSDSSDQMHSPGSDTGPWMDFNDEVALQSLVPYPNPFFFGVQAREGVAPQYQAYEPVQYVYQDPAQSAGPHEGQFRHTLNHTPSQQAEVAEAFPPYSEEMINIEAPIANGSVIVPVETRANGRGNTSIRHGIQIATTETDITLDQIDSASNQSNNDERNEDTHHASDTIGGTATQHVPTFNLIVVDLSTDEDNGGEQGQPDRADTITVTAWCPPVADGDIASIMAASHIQSHARTRRSRSSSEPPPEIEF